MEEESTKKLSTRELEKVAKKNALERAASHRRSDSVKMTMVMKSQKSLRPPSTPRWERQ